MMLIVCPAPEESCVIVISIRTSRKGEIVTDCPTGKDQAFPQQDQKSHTRKRLYRPSKLPSMRGTMVADHGFNNFEMEAPSAQLSRPRRHAGGRNRVLHALCVQYLLLPSDFLTAIQFSLIRPQFSPYTPSSVTPQQSFRGAPPGSRSPHPLRSHPCRRLA
jgi:hypothetical protein